MRKLTLLVSAIGTMCLSLLSAASLQAQETRDPIFVLQVGPVDVTLDKSNPPFVLIKAAGIVATPGHSTPRLVKVLYGAPPADGIQDLYFIVDAPRGVVPQVITTVETPLVNLGLAPAWMRGVRVWAKTNKAERSCC